MNYKTLTFRLDEQAKSDLVAIRLRLMDLTDGARDSSASAAVRAALRHLALEIERAENSAAPPQ